MSEPLPAAWDELVAGAHPNPHAILGVHPERQGGKPGVSVRAWHPDEIGRAHV